MSKYPLITGIWKKCPNSDSPNCQVDFYVIPSQKHRICCSRSCASEQGLFKGKHIKKARRESLAETRSKNATMRRERERREAQRQMPEMILDPDCKHVWHIGDSHLGLMDAECSVCGSTRQFPLETPTGPSVYNARSLAHWQRSYERRKANATL